MKNKTIIWLIIGVFLVILGSGLFVGVMTVYDWDFENLNTTEYQTKTYEVNQDFKNIKINANTADVVLIPSDDKTCKVICEEEVNSPHSVLTQSETLCVDNIEQKEWYEHIGINTKSPKIALYLPKTEYDSIIIKTDTGNTQLPENFEFKDISITTNTGDIFAKNITCKNIIANVSTGKTLLSDISCDCLLSSGDTGDIKLQKFIAHNTWIWGPTFFIFIYKIFNNSLLKLLSIIKNIKMILD